MAIGGLVLAFMCWFAAGKFVKPVSLVRDGQLNAAAEAFIDSYDFLEVFVVVILLNSLVTGVAFSIWSYKMAKRTRRLASGSAYGPGWAWGGWFVPLAQFFIPYAVMRDSERILVAAERGDVAVWQQVPTAGLTKAWWVFFSSTVILQSFAFRAIEWAYAEESPDAFADTTVVATLVFVIAGLAWLAALVTGCAMVERLSKLERKVFAA